ncbi:MAG: FHA domain-containing protein, partial [Anaerolineales bacterium]|nr:FHA domain-containing protein [Anaerolineales bacterium]MDW8448062.1 FHA domain-containing protein [Anaerolineales bacterium]
NPGEVFLLRDAQGFTRYDYLMDSLVGWARRRLGSTIDDLSLVVSEGPSRAHLNNPLELFYTLASYQVPREIVPSLDALIKGIEFAADPSPRFGMERVVLFITAPLSGDQSLAIQNTVQLAQQNGVRVYVWCLTTSALPTSQAIESLKLLAEQTQGRFWVLTKPEEQPDPEVLFEPLRTLYVLRYLASSSGGSEREVEVEVRIGEAAVRSQPISFQIDIGPPNIAFVSPPTEIIRQPVEHPSRRAPASEFFEPRYWELKLLVEFPDGRPRSIAQMRAYVDGQLVFERSEPPFESFPWDLRSYDQTGQHVLQVEVIDEFGFEAKTIATPIWIKVNRPPSSPLSVVRRNLFLAGLTLGVFSIALVTLGMAIRARLVPTAQRTGRRLGLQEKKALDPLRQPVPIPALEPLRGKPPAAKKVPNEPSTGARPAVLAYLYHLAYPEEQQAGGPFAMVREELPIGSSALRNLLVIDDPTVESVHALLVRQADGRFRIMDLGTLTGTWVNYTPVSKEGITLEDGDLIHIGRVGFRFRTSIREGKQSSTGAQPEENHP